MVDMPVEIFLSFIGFSIALAIFGFLRQPQIPAMLAFAGIFILTIAVITDNIQLGFGELPIIDSTESFNYTLSYPMEIITSNSAVGIGDTTHGAGERPINTNSLLFNKPISCISMDLSKTGSPTGTATIGILGDDFQIKKVFGTIDVSTILSSQKRYDFCLPNHDYWIVSLYDRVGFFYNTGSSGNTISVFFDTTNPFDGTNTVRTSLSNAGTWTDSTTSDLRMILTNEVVEINSAPVYGDALPNLVPFTELTKVLFALLGVIFMLSAGVMSIKN